MDEFDLLADTNKQLKDYYAGEIPKEIKDKIDRFNLSTDQIVKMRDVMEHEMKQGLSPDQAERKKSSLQMEITYVRDLYDGTEHGDFLALDLGGTNFRVLHVKLEHGKLVKCLSKNYNIPESILTGPCIHMFDHLAASIAKFLKEEKMEGTRYPLGFTYSFPMWQDGLNKGHLVTWTKSFRHPDGIGQDAVEQLNLAIERRGDVNIDIVAILNDTTGTLMSGAYHDHHCQIGLILGTGSNACYMEHLENIPKWNGDYDEPKQVVIDIEWGAFGDNHSLDFLKLDYDFQVDKNSNHVGSFTFEKLFSGMYIGEIARLVLEDLAKNGSHIFNGEISKKLGTEWAFEARHISMIEEDQDTFRKTDEVLEELGICGSDEDKKIVRYLSEVLTIRAAQLISCALSVLLNRIRKPQVTTAIDGSFYRYHPCLHDKMMYYLGLWAPETASKLILAEDGSGKGAGLVAAVACRMRKQ